MLANMKDFERWHILKCEIDANRNVPVFSEREIWWCSIGTNVGSEEDGKNDRFERPVLIVRKFNHDMFWGLPITSSLREGLFFYPIYLDGQIRTILLSHLRLFSPKRFRKYMGCIKSSEFKEVKTQLGKILGLQTEIPLT